MFIPASGERRHGTTRDGGGANGRQRGDSEGGPQGDLVLPSTTTTRSTPGLEIDEMSGFESKRCESEPKSAAAG